MLGPLENVMWFEKPPLCVGHSSRAPAGHLCSRAERMEFRSLEYWASLNFMLIFVP